MSTRRHDLGREVLGLKVTGTCRYSGISGRLQVVELCRG
jgi:hypothetical protein